MKREKREEILCYLHSLEGKYIYEDELNDVKRKCFEFMQIDNDEETLNKYSLNLFNGYLDDYFAKGKNKYAPRFRLRDDDRILLPDGSYNPHRFESYWKLI